MILATLADCQLAHGQFDEALGSVTVGLALSVETGQPFYDAELHRIAGDARLARDPGNAQGIESAEASFQEALHIARQQGARSLELRASVSLGRSWSRSGRRDEARDLLATAATLVEGGDNTSDSRDARALLDSLS